MCLESGALSAVFLHQMQEKMNSFREGRKNVKVKPLQWSLSAAAGAQFKITEKLGIYAEPGVVYSLMTAVM